MMSDITTYPKKKFIRAYFELDEAEKKVVYSGLSGTRKKWIDEAEKDPANRLQSKIEVWISFYNKKLKINLSKDVAKSVDELALVHTIIFQERTYEFDTSEYGNHREIEEKQFYKTKENMIKQLELMNERYHKIDTDPMIEELTKREFVPHRTYREFKKNRKALWDKMAEVALPNKSRAKRIVKECINAKKEFEKLSKQEKHGINEKIKRIDAYFRDNPDLQEFWLTALGIRLDAEDQAF